MATFSEVRGAAAKRWLRWSCALVVLLASSAGAFEKPPATGKKLSDFVPPSWSIESSLKGELIQGRMPAVVLVLVAETGEHERALVILAQESDGFRLVGSNASILSCRGCGGISHLSGEPDVQIRNRVLIVTSSGGSRQSWSYTWRFRLDAKSGRLVLIGYDEYDSDSITGEQSSTSINYLTGTEIDSSRAPGEDSPVRKVFKVEKVSRFIEDVRERD